MENADTIIGADPAFVAALDHVSELAKLNRPVLVMGERGSGKELIAARLHYLSRRWDGPYIRANCAAFTENLLESELFGHEAGAFTGAQRMRAGLLERADGGSLLLDEIGLAGPAVQEKLLRAVEYGEFERLGGTRTLSTDIRFIGATNEDLRDAVEKGAFRADLLDRLSFDVVAVPPLRRRPLDIPILAEYFARGMARDLGWHSFPGFTRAAEKAMETYDWPGNVREMRNVVERSVFRHGDPETAIDRIVIDVFPSDGEGKPAECVPEARGFDQTVGEVERRLIRDALTAESGNQAAAARRLDMDYLRFRRMAKKHGVIG
ncbi:MAG: sigma 54-interacting transcriptional regulator [Alphaproteobacteria bacterium]|nr:sigma 54-interacting transcriptional regulator [Alphaproteobacteria bacterium]